MKVVRRVVGCTMLGVVCALSPALGQSSPVGNWHGVLESPTGDLTLIVRIQADGEVLRGVLESPDQIPGRPIPIQRVVAQEGRLELTISAIAASYRGEWSDTTNAWVGTFTQGGEFPLTLKRGMPESKPVIAGLDGEWEGSIERAGQMFRLILKVITGDLGTTVTLDSPDMMSFGVPVSGFNRSGNNVRFTVPAASVTFVGTLSEGRPYRVLLDEMALDLIHLLDYRSIEKAVLCGLSMGVQIALDLVRLAPERVAGMVLAAGSARAETALRIERRRRLADQLEQDGSMERCVCENLHLFLHQDARADCRAFLAAMMRRCAVRGAAAALRGRGERRDHRSALANIHVPTLVIYGDSDSFTAPEEPRELASALPRGELALFNKTGHMPNIERVEEFNRALVALVRRTEATR